jgi:hypothetical protein
MSALGVGEIAPRNAPGLCPPWAPGQSGNPAGRPKGSRNKLGEDFIRALQEDFQEHGKQAIVEVRTERPHEYLKVVASILPKQVEIKEGNFDGFSEEQLAALVYAARSALDIVEGSGARTEAPVITQQAS